MTMMRGNSAPASPDPLRFHIGVADTNATLLASGPPPATCITCEISLVSNGRGGVSGGAGENSGSSAGNTEVGREVGGCI